MTALLLQTYLPSFSHDDGFLSSIISSVFLPKWQLSCFSPICRFAPMMTAFLHHECLPSLSHDGSLLRSWLTACSCNDIFLASIIFSVLLPWWQLSCLINVCHLNPTSLLAKFMIDCLLLWWQLSCFMIVCYLAPILTALLPGSWLTACSYNDSFLASNISAVLLPWWKLSCLMNVCHYCTVATFLLNSWLISCSQTGSFLAFFILPSCS